MQIKVVKTLSFIIPKTFMKFMNQSGMENVEFLCNGGEEPVQFNVHSD